VTFPLDFSSGTGSAQLEKEGSMLDNSRLKLLDRIFDQKSDQLRLNDSEEFRGIMSKYSPSRRDVSSRIATKLLSVGFNVRLFGNGFYSNADIIERVREGDSETLATVDLANLTPPKGIHWLAGSGHGVFLDLTNCDMFEELLAQNAMSFKEGGRYLDFGCSSGVNVRTFSAAYPEAQWAGVDPIQTAIEWATESYPRIRFFLGRQRPPLGGIETASFDGVYSKSVRSHFSRRMSIAWAEEMARIIKPGGFFMFTVPGYHRLAQRIANQDAEWEVKEGFIHPLSSQEMTDMSDSMFESGFFFKPLGRQHAYLADVGDWGDTYVDREWVVNEMLADLFELVDVGIARTWSCQDVYLCRRVGST
jgi:SAM-dependent methyltransferase